MDADEPRDLLGGMLVKGVPSWPRDMQVIGVEDRFLVFPQGDDLLRLYGCYRCQTDRGPMVRIAKRN